MDFDIRPEINSKEASDSVISAVATQSVFDQLAGNGRRGQMKKEGETDAESHEVENKNIHLFVDRARDIANKTGNKRILVAGCGDGFETELLSKMGFDVTAFDFSPNMVETTKRLVPDAHVQVADVTKIENSDIKGPFGGVIYGHVAQFIEDDKLVKKSISNLSALSPDGVMLLSTTYYDEPAHMEEWKVNGESIGATIYYAKKPEFLEASLQENGFSRIHRDHFDAGAGKHKNDYFLAEKTPQSI